MDGTQEKQTDTTADGGKGYIFMFYTAKRVYKHISLFEMPNMNPLSRLPLSSSIVNREAQGQTATLNHPKDRFCI